MLLQELYDYYGNWSELTRKLELACSTYQTWRKNGYIPYPTQLVIEKKTNGLFLASEEHGNPLKKKVYPVRPRVESTSQEK